MIEIRKSFSTRYGSRGGLRKSPIQVTPEAVQRVNEKNAEDKLRWLLLENFSPGDWHLILTYRKTDRPDADGSKKMLERFLRDLRVYFRKRLGADLRYITVTEYKSTAIHHHVVIPSCDIRPVQKLWPWGKIRPTDITDAAHLINLASYLIKETSRTFREGVGYRKRWNASRNLRKPVIKREVIRQRAWTDKPRPVRGYRIDKTVGDAGVENYEDMITGALCQFYRMVRNE